MKLFRKPSSAPLWQDEFPVFTADERYVNRRQLTKFLTLTSFAMLVGNLWVLLRSLMYRSHREAPLVVASTAEVPVGGVKLFSYPTDKDPCILVRRAAESYVAYSQVCPHLSCVVYYSKERNRLECPCHQGVFSIQDGSVIQGPPQRPLPRIALERREGQLVAVRVEQGGA